MRLIDADKLIKDIVNLLQPARPDETEMYKVDDIFWSLEKLIKEQPTAFDLDRVVQELEDVKELNEPRINNKTLERDIKIYKLTMNFAIKIVKAGGLDDR